MKNYFLKPIKSKLPLFFSYPNEIRQEENLYVNINTDPVDVYESSQSVIGVSFYKPISRMINVENPFIDPKKLY